MLSDTALEGVETSNASVMSISELSIHKDSSCRAMDHLPTIELGDDFMYVRFL